MLHWGLYMLLAKGMTLDQFVGSQSGILFDINEGHGTLLFVVDEPYLSQYKLGGHYDFWCKCFDETLFFAVKLRENPWASAPYSPFMSKKYEPEFYPKGTGMSLIVALISTADGIVKDMDFMVLGNKFSNTISVLNQQILSKGFNPVRYQATIQSIYQRYPTDEELVNQPGAIYSID